MTSQSREIERLRELNGTSLVTDRLSGQGDDGSSIRITGPVVGHLGRLVLGDDNAEFFAGSTTGVHFVLSAQQQYQSAFSSREHFPECMFRLHVLQPTHLRGTSTGHAHSFQEHCGYIRKVGVIAIRGAYERYFQDLGSLYPILLRKQFFEALDEIMTDSSLLLFDQNRLAPFLLQVLALMALDSAKSIKSSPITAGFATSDMVDYNAALSNIYGRMPCRGDLSSLQGLFLYLVYLQITSQHSLGIRVCGKAVRLAQSLGLHRHSRRFRHSPGEAELRKRLWWAVFAVDVYGLLSTFETHLNSNNLQSHSSILYGLPRTIQLADTDTDLPINTDYDDLCCDQLSYPLPGETTNIEPFLHHVLLTEILSRCLEQMYTTTNRRGGVKKIRRLQREIEVWQQNVQSALPGIAIVKQKVYTKLQNIKSNSHSTALPAQNADFSSWWLFMLGELAVMLIHRPALTFGPHEPQFVESLQSCVEAATHLILSFDFVQNEYLITRLWPLGYHFIFQSGLTLLYDRWFEDLPRPSRTATNIPHLASLICIAVNVLSKHATLLDEATVSEDTDFSSSTETMRTLRQTASCLHRLFIKTIEKGTVSDQHALTMQSTTEVPTPGLDSIVPDFDGLQNVDPLTVLPEFTASMWPSLSIDEINQMEIFEFTDSLLMPWDA